MMSSRSTSVGPNTIRENLPNEKRERRWGRCQVSPGMFQGWKPLWTSEGNITRLRGLHTTLIAFSCSVQTFLQVMWPPMSLNTYQMWINISWQRRTELPVSLGVTSPRLMNDRQVGVELFGNLIVHQSLICPLQEGDSLGVVFSILSIMGVIMPPSWCFSAHPEGTELSALSVNLSGLCESQAGWPRRLVEPCSLPQGWEVRLVQTRWF